MFPKGHSRLQPALLHLTVALLALLVGATGGTLWLVFELRKEQRAINELLRVHTSEKIDTLASFPDEFRWQLLLAVALLFVLGAAFIVLALMLRGYLNSLKSLRDLARQFRDIHESLGQGLITGDQDGRIFMMNREAIRMLGSGFPGNDGSFAALDSRTGLTLDPLARDVAGEARSIEDHPHEFVNHGDAVHLLVDGLPLRDEAGKVHGSVLHLRDVTERELIRKRVQRMEGYMGLGPVAAGLQHEIKNPLGALSLHVQLLAEKLSRGEGDDARENLEVLKTEVKRIGSVLEEFRNYADAEALNLETGDLESVIRHAVKLVLPQARKKEVKIEFTPPPKPVRLMVDEARVQQVVLNLLLNALDVVSAPGGIRLELKETDSCAELLVSDDGPGISRAALSHVFDPYFTTKAGGLGMGLAVCRKIARLHDGDLDFTTGPDGTTFRLTLSRNIYGKL